jgi:hypothetical protein
MVFTHFHCKGKCLCCIFCSFTTFPHGIQNTQNFGERKWELNLTPPLFNNVQHARYKFRPRSNRFVSFLIIANLISGNVFVIAAILLERNLQNVANYLILSLAVADLLVACLVMPLGAVYEVSQEWTLGPELCDMWTSSDVLCCTASILHLVAIALDR